MKRFLVLLAAFWCHLIVVSGISRGEEPQAVYEDITFLLQSWTHSYEEEAEGSPVLVFRPSAFKEFPPSRFRMRYSFQDNGQCSWLFLSPVDAHFMNPGKWRLDLKNKNYIHMPRMATGEMTAYQIVELTKHSMKLIEKEPPRAEPELRIQRSGHGSIQFELLGSDDSETWVVQESFDGIHWRDHHVYDGPFSTAVSEGQPNHLFRAARSGG
jgi:hypothetical protein